MGLEENPMAEMRKRVRARERESGCVGLGGVKIPHPHVVLQAERTEGG